jgi:hypothetical protein
VTVGICHTILEQCFYLLQMGIINSHCQLIDPESIRAELQHLKTLNVDGVVVDCWWGIVEAWIPRKYEWSGYRDLFGIIKEFKLKVQVRSTFLSLQRIDIIGSEVYSDIHQAHEFLNRKHTYIVKHGTDCTTAILCLLS